MIDNLANALVSVNKEAAVVILGAMPVSELRGAIPLAIALDLSPLKAYMLAVAGNLLPVVPLLLLLRPVSERLRKIPLFDRFFTWLFERTRNKADLIERFEALGLILFVAVPLPVTGAWTGCVAATLFKIRFRYALPAIIAGVLIAGIIVLVLSLAGKGMLTSGA
ncbi:MAG: small multi-drug export protein [Candidatus Omnitrophota bacterium]|nr:small multi-drug export protein [Candidatus Omnitrophota bacterium]